MSAVLETPEKGQNDRVETVPTAPISRVEIRMPTRVPGTRVQKTPPKAKPKSRKVAPKQTATPKAKTPGKSTAKPKVAKPAVAPSKSEAGVVAVERIDPVRLNADAKAYLEQRVVDLYRSGSPLADISRLTGTSHNYPRHVLRRTEFNGNPYFDAKWVRAPKVAKQ